MDRDRPTWRTLLFRDYVLPFEIVSVLLTAAVVGGVLLARRELGSSEEDRRERTRSTPT